jgi:quinoprotein glucose dehydrogenase
VEGLPLFKPPYGRITAIDLNTGEQLWWIPNGDTPDNIRNHPMLQGIDVGRTGAGTHATTVATRTLLIYGEGRSGRPLLHAVDKRTGKELATVEIPAPTTTAPMTFMHDGNQYIVSAIGGGDHPAALVALRLPR